MTQYSFYLLPYSIASTFCISTRSQQKPEFGIHSTYTRHVNYHLTNMKVSRSKSQCFITITASLSYQLYSYQPFETKCLIFRQLQLCGYYIKSTLPGCLYVICSIFSPFCFMSMTQRPLPLLLVYTLKT